MKKLSLLFALSLVMATSTVFAEDQLEIDFIQGSDYVDFAKDSPYDNSYTANISKNDFSDDELDVDHISGSEYVAMAEEMAQSKGKQSWFAFLSLK